MFSVDLDACASIAAGCRPEDAAAYTTVRRGWGPRSRAVDAAFGHGLRPA